jgi:hypothetical protein
MATDIIFIAIGLVLLFVGTIIVRPAELEQDAPIASQVWIRPALAGILLLMIGAFLLWSRFH